MYFPSDDFLFCHLLVTELDIWFMDILKNVWLAHERKIDYQENAICYLVSSRINLDPISDGNKCPRY
jgi:hypothetical protein